MGYTDKEDSLILKGEVKIVYRSSEKSLRNDKWTSYFQLPHVLTKSIPFLTGEHNSKSHIKDNYLVLESPMDMTMRFNRGQVGKIKASVGNVPLHVLALSATVSRKSRARLIHTLRMKDPLVIVKSPDRENLCLFVRRVHDDVKNPSSTLTSPEREAKPVPEGCCLVSVN